MAQRTRVTLKNNFPKVKSAATSTVVAARQAALKVGKSTAQKKIRQVNAARSYNLPDSVGTEQSGTSSGVLYLGESGEFWWRFFEYGTIYIDAFPIIRPAGKAMNTAFQSIIVASLDKTIKRKAGLH